MPGAFSAFPINVPTVTKGMNDDSLFVAENFIDNAVVTHAKLIESCKIICQWGEVDDIKICGQLIDTFNNAVANRFVQPS